MVTDNQLPMIPKRKITLQSTTSGYFEVSSLAILVHNTWTKNSYRAIQQYPRRSTIIPARSPKSSYLDLLEFLSNRHRLRVFRCTSSARAYPPRHGFFVCAHRWLHTPSVWSFRLHWPALQLSTLLLQLIAILVQPLNNIFVSLSKLLQISIILLELVIILAQLSDELFIDSKTVLQFLLLGDSCSLLNHLNILEKVSISSRLNDAALQACRAA